LVDYSTAAAHLAPLSKIFKEELDWPVME